MSDERKKILHSTLKANLIFREVINHLRLEAIKFGSDQFWFLVSRKYNKDFFLSNVVLYLSDLELQLVHSEFLSIKNDEDGVPTTITTCYYFLTKNGQNALWILLNHSCPVLKHYLAIFFFLWTNFRFCFILLCSMTVKAVPWNLDVFTTIVDFQSSYFLDRFKLGEIFIAFEREQHLRRTFETDSWNRHFKRTVQTKTLVLYGSVSQLSFQRLWNTCISIFVAKSKVLWLGLLD